MKVITLLLGIIISFNSCGLIALGIGTNLSDEEYKNLIDQRYEHYWEGKYNEKNYVLTIHSSHLQERYFLGIIIIDDSDTIFLKGFEKGSLYVTNYETSLNDTATIRTGGIFICGVGQYTDSVFINNRGNINDVFPEELILVRKNKGLNFFKNKRMTQGLYIESQVSELVNYNKKEPSLRIILQERVSKNFTKQFFNQTKIDGYLVKNDGNYSAKASQLSDYLSKFFSFEIINLTNNNYFITNDLGLPIIQEAKDKNGKWRPIEYILLNGSTFASTIKLPQKSKIEIAAPRYKGDYETDLRLKIAIEKYGILTSNIYQGRINYSQFKKPKSKKLSNKLHFLD